LVEMIIPSSVEVMCGNCFSSCGSLSSLTFASGSRLSRIERGVFFYTGLIEIIIPASVEALGENCFSSCSSLSSVTFASGSRLSRIERGYSLTLA
jgi:hypothetical protein